MYVLKASNKSKLLEKCRDARPWQRGSKTKWKNYDSVRYTKCSGSLQCPNENCDFFIQYKFVNQLKFDKNSVCTFCGENGKQIICPARKYIAINGLTACIFHYGRHTCGKRQKTGRSFMLVPEAISTDPRMIQSQVQFSKLYIAVLKLIRQRKNWRDIEKKVKLVLSKKVTSYEKITQRKYIQPLKTGFDAVKKYEKFTDQKDQLYVLMINESQQIVFMTSSVKMKLAKKMSSESENSLSLPSFAFLMENLSVQKVSQRWQQVYMILS